jgi:hypothetical protein
MLATRLGEPAVASFGCPCRIRCCPSLRKTCARATSSVGCGARTRARSVRGRRPRLGRRHPRHQRVRAHR